MVVVVGVIVVVVIVVWDLGRGRNRGSDNASEVAWFKIPLLIAWLRVVEGTVAKAGAVVGVRVAVVVVVVVVVEV